MAGLLEWNPIQELDEWARRFSPKIFREKSFWPNEEIKELVWNPSVDIAEEEKEYIITAEVAEVPKNALKVFVDHGILSLSGYRFRRSENKGTRYYRVERDYGDFLRSFSLPDNADPSKISANLKEGVLTIHVAKRAESIPKGVDIPVG